MNWSSGVRSSEGILFSPVRHKNNIETESRKKLATHCPAELLYHTKDLKPPVHPVALELIGCAQLGRFEWAGRVIKEALTKGNLSFTISVLTAFRPGQKRATNTRQLIYGGLGLEVVHGSVGLRKYCWPALGSPEEVTTRTWEVKAPSPPSLRARTSMV